MRLLDLFSGIGGFSLAARWTGCMETVAFCEIDPFCQKVLAHHWPGVPIFDDIKQLTAESLRQRGIGDIDIITGGFPCQDLSSAGKGEGLAGSRSGLWFELLRVIEDVRPRWVVCENVPAIRTKPGIGTDTAIDTVLSGLEQAGYSCRSLVVGAEDVGAPHRRKRVWILAHSGGSTGAAGAERPGRAQGADLSWRSAGTELAYPGHHAGRAEQPEQLQGTGGFGQSGEGAELADPDRVAAERRPGDVGSPEAARAGETQERERLRDSAGHGGDGGNRTMGNSHCERESQPGGMLSHKRRWVGDSSEDVADSNGAGRGEQRGAVSGSEFLRASQLLRDGGELGDGAEGSIEPGMGGATHGLPGWVARWPAGRGEVQYSWEASRVVAPFAGRQEQLKGLGNAVVPYNAYCILAVIALLDAL